MIIATLNNRIFNLQIFSTLWQYANHDGICLWNLIVKRANRGFCEMDFTFFMSCEFVSDRSRTGVCVGSSKIDFQLAGYTFYLANTSLGYLIFLIP